METLFQDPMSRERDSGLSQLVSQNTTETVMLTLQFFSFGTDIKFIKRDFGYGVLHDFLQLFTKRLFISKCGLD